MSDFAPLRVDLRAIAAVAGGALIGGPLRYGVESLMPTDDRGFPWATLSVNVGGSFVLALLLVIIFESAWSAGYMREFAGVGLLGSFTTFSTWMAELRDQAARNDWAQLAAYLGASIVLGLTAAALGIAAGRVATTRRRR
jgi:fluoride exporter